MPDLSRPQRSIVLKDPRVYLAIVLLLAALIIWRIAVFTEQYKLNQLRRTGESRITLYAGSLQDSLEKYRHVPYLLSRDIRIRKLLKGSHGPVKVNPHLEDFTMTADALIFVMDSTGNTVASSNWRTEQSLVDNNFAFRPYFQDAQEGKSGSYYAVGFKTRKPGFFISYPVLESGRLLGVVVVKAYLEKLEKIWRESGETIIVSDSFGVLFLSSRPKWKYKSLRPLPIQTASRLREVQYLERPLSSMEMDRQATEGGNILHLDNISFLEQSLQLLDYGWRIHYLTDLTPVTTSVRLAMVTTTILFAAVFLILLYLRERRQTLLSRQEAREATAIRQLNELLIEEINQHKETERTLQKTQKELIQAGKLAALGRMSAAIAHELNQPVTAIRTFIASCKIFIERQQADKVEENLEFINRLTERMSSITGQLKTFARKSKSHMEPVDLAEVIDRVLAFIGPQLDQSGVLEKGSACPWQGHRPW
jgi:two-component system, NtrC family, C4-dicarboxylate transport sensor histidine kinase DctB